MHAPALLQKLDKYEGDHCQNSTLYKIIHSDHLITELQVRQQTVRIIFK